MNALFLTDVEGRSLPRNEKILYILLVLFFATLYLPTMPVINNCFIALIFVHSFFFNSISAKLQFLKQRKSILCMILFYLLHVISAFFSENKEEALRMLGMRIPLLMFPIAIGLIYIRKELKERIMLAYALTVTVAAATCFVTALVKYRESHDTQFLYNDNLTSVTGLQSIYFALMVNLAIFGYAYLVINKSAVLKSRGWILLAIFFLAGINFLLASRVSIIVLYGSLLGFAVFYIIRKRKFLEGATLVLGMVIGCFLMIKFFPKTINRFRELGYTEYRYNSKGAESHFNMEISPEQWNGANIRLAVWSCGWELVKQYPVFGAQLGDKKGKMMEIYKSRQFDFALKTKRNMHNNYLDVLCTFGIVGLVLFLAGYFIYPLMVGFRSGDTLGICFIAMFAFAMISETYLDRSLGCILTGFFLSFIAGYSYTRPASAG